MSGEQQLSGPDLTQGVSLSDIPAGAASGQPAAGGAPSGCLLGHAGGEPVLLARVGDEVFAIAAHCTHYGGPLAEGLLVGDTVRCPWHHACFSLRSGEPLRAPALNPVARYRVERHGDRVTVHEKLPPALPPTAPARTAGAAAAAGEPESVVIVGAGAAGNAAAQRLRREGYAGPVTLIGADDSPPYDRPNISKDYLAGNAPEEWIPLHPRELYDDRRIELRLGERVTAIDPRRRTVTLAGGATLGWGALLLATGAEPVRLELPGGDLPHVHYLRTLADSRGIIAQIANTEKLRAAAAAGAPPPQPPRAVVLGGSFIGLEVAASLRARQLEVTVVDRGAVPLARAMGSELGSFVRALHEEHGVAFRLGQQAAAIDPEAVTLASGERLPAGLVVIGVGVRPALQLAVAAGLAVDGGVLVDEYLQTSAPGIYAAGDIARWPDPHTGERLRVEHWVVAERQGQTAAANILGRRERFDAAPFFWSQHYDVQISYVGHAPSPGKAGGAGGAGGVEVRVAGSLAARDAAVVFRAAGQVRAVATVFRDRLSLEAELALERGDQAALAALTADQKAKRTPTS
jgi:NADPH-dependent 2,4-dienoyl-CoA reductase/sulfur reductase-like enzyme/nitrite reductase/ring-hydroxylating ferredoxin subunit